jgi:hypothetical protein
MTNETKNFILVDHWLVQRGLWDLAVLGQTVADYPLQEEAKHLLKADPPIVCCIDEYIV